MLTGGVSAAAAGVAGLHPWEGRVAVAVGTEHEGLPLGPGTEVNQLKAV